MTKNEKIKTWVTLALAIVGGILGMAQDVVNIQGVGKISNWATTVIAFALSAKQILTLILDNTNKLPTIIAFSALFSLSFSGCTQSLEGLSKDEKRNIILQRELRRANLWSSIGSGLAQGLGAAATGWLSTQSNSGPSSKPLPNDNSLRK